MNNITILKLIEKFRLGDMEAFLQIYNQFKDLIGFYACKTDDEDTVQELTVFLLELLYDVDIKRFYPDTTDALQRYIAVSIRNKYIALSKKEQKYHNIIKEVNSKDSFCVDLGYDLVYLRDLIKLLPLKQAMVIVYRYIHGYSDAEIAELLGIKRQSVFNIRKKALENLKLYM